MTKEDFLATPLRLASARRGCSADHEALIDRVVDAVDALSSVAPAGDRRMRRADPPTDDEARREAEIAYGQRRLDEAVFSLFELLPAERDLVRDFWTYSYDAHRFGADSVAGRTVPLGRRRLGREADLHDAGETVGLHAYIRTFLRFWNGKVGDGEEFAWSVATSRGDAAIAVTFELVEEGGPADHGEGILGRDWRIVLDRLQRHADRPVTPSLLADRIVRVVTDQYFVIVKGNERRRWSASAAAEDAEAVLLQAMRLPSPGAH